MKIQTRSQRSHRGFTLIELLVVIAIIAVLAAMGFGAGAMAINKAKRTHALSDCTNLVNAIQAFYDDYSTLPDLPDAASAPGARSNSDLMNMLVGGEFDTENNPKRERYFSGRDAKGASVDRAYGGIYYDNNNADLFDPWRKVTGASNTNRHYFVMLDDDLDDRIEDPFNSNKPLFGRRAIIWSTGKDGQYTIGQEATPKNRDNVYSWQ